MSEERKTAVERLAEVEARRAAKAAAKDEARAEQRILDLEACEAITDGLGADVLTDMVDVEWGPGLPTLIMVRCPTRPELSRYRSGIKQKDGAVDAKSATEAAELLAAVCVLYPARKAPPGEKSAWDVLCEARPGAAAGAGSAAIKLSVARAQAEGNE